jgi:hypothetical protein
MIKLSDSERDLLRLLVLRQLREPFNFSDPRVAELMRIYTKLKG